MGDGTTLTPLFVAIIAIVALVAGFAGGNYLAGQQGSGAGQQQAVGLTLDDRNFIVTVANLQMGQITQATALQSAQLDWCTAGGGQWFTQARQAALPVTEQQAQQLRQQGANVQQLQDGNYVAAVILVDRGSCVAIPTNTGG